MSERNIHLFERRIDMVKNRNKSKEKRKDKSKDKSKKKKRSFLESLEKSLQTTLSKLITDGDEVDQESPSDESFVEDRSAIARYLRNVSEEDILVEIQLNGMTRIFHSQFMDHLPELVEEVDEEGEIVFHEPVYTPYSYFARHHHILIQPLIPEAGNQQIQASEYVSLLFFHGVKAFETFVVFQKALEIRGEPAIQLSFPDYFEILPKRRFYRAKTILKANILLTLQSSTMKKPQSLALSDIGEGGLAFINPLDKDAFPINESVQMVIEAPDLKEKVKINGFVRHHFRIKGKRPRERRKVCAVQFDTINVKQSLQIGNLVAHAQRIHLKNLATTRSRGQKGL